MRKKAYMLGREMIWSHVAHHYMESFQRARRSRQDMPFKPLAVRTLAEQPTDLPGWRLDHLVRMTDSTGIFQHASYTIPNFAEGYCTDDNARALLLTVLLEQLGPGSAADPSARRRPTRRSCNYAFDRDRSRFRNFMSFDRRWLEEVGSEDCQGRALWALGACVHRSQRPRPPVLGLAALRPGPAGAPGDDLAPGLGLRPARHLPVPPAAQRRPAGQPDPRHPDRPADRAFERTADAPTGPGSRRS